MGTEDSDDVEGTLKEPKAKKKVKKVAKKVTKKAAKKNGSATRAPVKEEGIVTILDLASEAGITSQAVRVKLRASDLDRGEGRWKFEDGSKRLKEARKILGIGA